VSKSSFLLLSVAFLAAAAGFKASGVRREELSRAFHYEVRADIAAFRDDARNIRNQAVRAPYAFKTLWDDVCRDIRTLKADAAADAHTIVAKTT
jgi:hypothetical protein